jgi:hypothetical protein
MRIPTMGPRPDQKAATPMKAIVALLFLLVTAAPTWATPINVLIMEGEARNFVIGGSLSVVGITGDGRLLTGGGASSDFFGSNSSFDCSTSGCRPGFPISLSATYVSEPPFGTRFVLEGAPDPFILERAFFFFAEPAVVPDAPGRCPCHSLLKDRSAHSRGRSHSSCL